MRSPIISARWGKAIFLILRISYPHSIRSYALDLQWRSQENEITREPINSNMRKKRFLNCINELFAFYSLLCAALHWFNYVPLVVCSLSLSLSLSLSVSLSLCPSLSPSFPHSLSPSLFLPRCSKLKKYSRKWLQCLVCARQISNNISSPDPVQFFIHVSGTHQCSRSKNPRCRACRKRRLYICVIYISKRQHKLPKTFASQVPEASASWAFRLKTQRN